MAVVQDKISFTLEEILYYAAFAVILFTKGVGMDEGSFLFRGCLLVGLLLLAVKFFVGQYSIAEIAAAGILGIWSAFTFKITGSLGMFIYVLLIVGMKHVPVKRVFVAGTVVWGVYMLYSVTASIFFERTGVRLVHEKLGLGPVLRESLGYTHPNVLHITYIVLMAFVLYLCSSDWKRLLKAACVLLLGDVFVFMYSVSFTGLIFSFLLLILFFWFYWRKELNVVEKVLIQGMPTLCIVVSVALPLLLEDGILYKAVNKILNNRIWAIRTYFQYYDVTLFGGGNEGITFSLDNSYVSALNGYGVIPLLLIMAAYSLLLRDCIKKNRRAELAIICTFLFAGLSEPFLFNASVKNITVIFLGELLYRKIGERGYIFRLFSVHNKRWDCPLNSLIRVKGLLQLVKWKVICVVALTSGILCFCSLLPKDCVKVEKVYADERLCDIGGDTVRLPQSEDTSKVLFIGDISNDTNYYFLTRENSDLIEIMDLRYKVSMSLYIMAAAACFSMFFWIFFSKVS